MLKIVVVDDEEIVLDGMKMVLEASGRDWTVVGTALDGFRGLDEIRDKKPDIVITDIKMPELDGLEMINIVKRELPETIIFVFSGYAEFNLAQQAIELGVYNYLLKPVNYEEIYEALDKAQEFIKERKMFHLEQEDLKRKLTSSIPLLKEKLLSDIIHGIISVNDSVFYRLEYLDFAIENAFLATIKIDDFDAEWQNLNAEDRFLLLFAIRNITEEICSSNCSGSFVVNDSDDSLCIIITGQQNNKALIISLCESIRNSISKYLNRTVSIGIGRFIEGINDLYPSYCDSLKAIQGSLFRSRNVTVHIDEVCGKTGTGSYSIAAEKNIISAVKTGDIKSLKKELDAMYAQLGESSLEYIKRVYYELYISLSRNLYESNINAEEILSEKINLYHEISRCPDAESLAAIILQVFEMLTEHVSGLKQNHRNKIIDEVLKYIEENYSRNITLKEAAERVYLNINYLSELFKAELGENFTEYLKKHRIKKAIELMGRMDLKIYHIAEMVGYSDAKHFSQVFKEITGKSPKDYKVGAV